MVLLVKVLLNISRCSKCCFDHPVPKCSQKGRHCFKLKFILYMEYTQRTTESNTLQGFVTFAIDSEIGY